jgi:hypothetical protein
MVGSTSRTCTPGTTSGPSLADAPGKFTRRFAARHSRTAVSAAGSLSTASAYCARLSQKCDDIPYRRKEMILATTKVEDFDRFVKTLLTKGAEKRRQHGSKGSSVFRDPNEADRVWVLFDWDGRAGRTSSPTPRSPRSFKKPGTKVGLRRRRSAANTTPSTSTRCSLPPWPSPGGRGPTSRVPG